MNPPPHPAPRTRPLRALQSTLGILLLATLFTALPSRGLVWVVFMNAESGHSARWGGSYSSQHNAHCIVQGIRERLGCRLQMHWESPQESVNLEIAALFTAITESYIGGLYASSNALNGRASPLSHS